MDCSHAVLGLHFVELTGLGELSTKSNSKAPILNSNSSVYDKEYYFITEDLIVAAP